PDDVLPVDGYLVARADPRRQPRRRRVHLVGEILRPVHERLVLDADTALVVVAVARVVRHVQLADHLRHPAVLPHDVVRGRPVPRVLERLHRAVEAALRDMHDHHVDAVVVGPVRAAPVGLRGGDPAGAREIDLARCARLLHPRRTPPQAGQLVPGQHRRARRGRHPAHDQGPPPDAPVPVLGCSSGPPAIFNGYPAAVLPAPPYPGGVMTDTPQRSRPLRVLAAMSGGVDSAVAAARAAEAGHDVTGVHLALSANPQSFRTGARGCCTIEDSRDARRAADVIGIPFYVWDLADRFREDVVEDFVAEYEAGRTPNPCLRCNEKIKFAALLDKALALGFDAVCTGHYAKVILREDGTREL